MGFKRFFIIPAFALIFGAFGVIDTAWTAPCEPTLLATCFQPKDSCIDPAADGIAYVCDDSGKDPNFTVDFSYGTLYGTGICSEDPITDPFVEIGTPIASPDGQYCWCRLNGFENEDGDYFVHPAGFAVAFDDVMSDAAVCQEKCPCTCQDMFYRNAYSREALYEAMNHEYEDNENEDALFCESPCTHRSNCSYPMVPSASASPMETISSSVHWIGMPFISRKASMT